MSKTAKTVARQASFLMVASTAQKLISFLAFTYAAWGLGVEGVGTYFYLLSLSSLAGAWTDLGLTPIVIRAFSASEEEGWRLVRAAVKAKALLIPLAAAGAAAYLFFADAGRFAADPLHQGLRLLPLFAIALLVMAEDAVSLLGYGILRGRQRLDIESAGMVLGQFIASGGLVLAVWLGFGVPGALAALALGSFWHVFWSLFWVRRLAGAPASGSPYPWTDLVRSALPFALAGIFVRVYSSVDSLMLKAWHGTSVVGQYAVAYKLTYALQFLPLAFVAALYPALSAAHARKDETELVHTALGSWRFMALLGFPLAAALSGFAPRLLPWLYGQAFAPAATVLAVLAWVLPTIFLDFPIGSYLNATHRAAQKTVAMGAAMVVNILANLLLVPRFGGAGAAVSAVLGFAVLLGVGLWYARSVFASPTALLVLARSAALGAGLWSLIRFGFSRMPLLAGLALAPIAAIGLAFALGLVRWDDLAMLRDGLRRKTAV